MAVIGINGYIGSGKDTVGQMIQFHTYNRKRELSGFGKLYYGRAQSPPQRLEENNWQIKKFAGKLKQIVSILIGVPVEELEKDSVKSSELGEEWDWIHTSLQMPDRKWILVPGEVHSSMEDRAKKRTVREVLQLVGTEGIRNTIHQNAWVNALFTDYNPRYEDFGKEIKEQFIYPNWIITDTRFENEAKAIKDREGLVIRVNRPNGLGDFNSVRHSSETSLDNYNNFDYILDNDGTKEELLEKVKIMMDELKLWESN